MKSSRRKSQIIVIQSSSSSGSPPKRKSKKRKSKKKGKMQVITISSSDSSSPTKQKKWTRTNFLRWLRTQEPKKTQQEWRRFIKKNFSLFFKKIPRSNLHNLEYTEKLIDEIGQIAIDQTRSHARFITAKEPLGKQSNVSQLYKIFSKIHGDLILGGFYYVD